jgi:hypothetical protein
LVGVKLIDKTSSVNVNGNVINANLSRFKSIKLFAGVKLIDQISPVKAQDDVIDENLC